MTVIQPVILSGGSGSRLWPASRSKRPKQFIPLLGDRTMFQRTVSRVDGLANAASRAIVVCNEAHRFFVAQQLEVLSREADLVLEPEGRNTAPAIALAALQALAINDETPVLLVMPADHLIDDNALFCDTVTNAMPQAEEGALVTFGVIPKTPHTGYGYIEANLSGGVATPVRSFVEKPDADNAQEYLAGGRHFWNSGMFLFRADVYLDELERFAPDMVATCRSAMEAKDQSGYSIRPDPDRFSQCPSDSIDYAVMEKTDKAMMMPLDSGWNDIGSWSAIHEVGEQDDAGNSTEGDVILADCSGCLVRSESRLVSVVGMDDVIVVETKDSVLVTSKENAQDVKRVVEQLKSAGREEKDLHRQVYRPWGSYDSIDSGDGFQVKRLIVNPGAVLSLQMHHRRAEHWIVVRGTATITLNDDIFELNVNESTHIPVGATHRIANEGDVPVHIIEVQCGDYLGEDDIVRFEDNYGRAGTTS
jgi:mannose-1-phosphate guanylyltransferase/mannose-6-phosphate isomerase